jgi:hypothetical protein
VEIINMLQYTNRVPVVGDKVYLFADTVYKDCKGEITGIEYADNMYWVKWAADGVTGLYDESSIVFVE